jgi:hypothetical protein
MTEPEKVEWAGASGKKYTYWVYALPANLSSRDGNYIYPKIGNGLWQPIYIGEGDLGQRTDIDQHHQSYCLKRKGVTHVHAHKNEKEADRLAEEKDLLRNYTQAYQPTGCNET